jgi:signal peptidase II
MAETTEATVDPAETPPPRSAADDRLRRNRILGFGLATAILLTDQGVKWIVTYVLQLKQRLSMEFTSFFKFSWEENKGVSMGFLKAGTELERWLLVAMTAAISVFVLAWMWREKRRDDTIALAFVLGGAVGNILDRVRLGYVVDFADLHFGNHPNPADDVHPFLIFNVGDAAITIGVLLLLVRALLTRERKAPEEDK